jgi:hypothetical protein
MRSGRRFRSRQLLIVATFAAALGLASAIAALTDSPSTEAAGRAQTGDVPDHITIRLRQVDDSGVSGKATLRAEDGITTVAIRLDASDGAYPAHIHEGTCDEFHAMPGFPLADAEPGQTTRTIVEISLAELLSGAYVINVHRPSTDLDVLLDPSSVVACGAIALERSSTATSGTDGVTSPPVTGVGPAISDDSFGALAIGLAALACALAGAGIVLRRSERRLSSPYAT